MELYTSKACCSTVHFKTGETGDKKKVQTLWVNVPQWSKASSQEKNLIPHFRVVGIFHQLTLKFSLCVPLTLCDVAGLSSPCCWNLVCPSQSSRGSLRVFSNLPFKKKHWAGRGMGGWDLVVQCLRFHAPSAEGLGSILGWGSRPHLLQLEDPMPQLKNLQRRSGTLLQDPAQPNE